VTSVPPGPDDPAPGRRRRPGPLLTNAATLAGGLIVFFSVPVRTGSSTPVLLRSCALGFLGVAIVGWVVVRQVRGSGRRDLTPLQLVMLAEIVACAFSLVYYAIAVYDADEIVGVRTRLDALYFTLSTMSTVGYGDVHAASQLARGVVTAHLAFNLVFLGVLARLLQRQIGERTGTRR
jgi:voltage-gated potassium channel